MTDWLNEDNTAPEQNVQNELPASDDAEDEIETEQDSYDSYDDEPEYSDADDEGYDDEYEEDYGEGEEPAEGEEDGEPNESEYVMSLIDYLVDQIANPAQTGSFMSKPKVDTEACLEILDNLRKSIPAGIRHASHAAREEQRVLENAQKIAANRVELAVTSAKRTKAEAEQEAKQIIDNANAQAADIIAGANAEKDRIIAKAQKHARHLINEDEVHKEAEKEAKELKKRSVHEANEYRAKAIDDSWKLLSALRRQVDAISANIDKKMHDLYPDEE